MSKELLLSCPQTGNIFRLASSPPVFPVASADFPRVS